ncbi:hypothetical protein VTK73DRAFT_7671 [Phialemonium thermophilum]|uniref:Zn(2)-C6 fungal-type domain-containing protein n=1 Tax=Phialemonium thermophilum TaxID=223376 RepID=A0ABR3Y6G7_9PEZI
MSTSPETPTDTIMVTTHQSPQSQDSNTARMAEEGPTAGGTEAAAAAGENSTVPKPKRLACTICRKRKLKCNGAKPRCSTCARLGHDCAYVEVRKKSGPKRGYVKALEERLRLVETLLQAHDSGAATSDMAAKPISSAATGAPNPNHHAAATANFNVTDPSIGIASGRDMDRWRLNAESPQNGSMDDFNFNNNITMGVNNMDSNFTWEMIGLGLEEPLPPQETIDELHQIYFEKVHPSVPMIHKFRYLTAMNLAPNQRPPVCLRYAMWTLACSVTEKYVDLKDLFYQRARKYVESDYVKGFGEHIISVAHAQTHILLAGYEFKMMYFPRAWMSTGSAVRLCQMIGLHRLDSPRLDVKQCLPPPRDWTEREERRRTFWMAFCKDRYASIGTGWSMIIDEKDIMTNMPASNEAFELSRPEETSTLEDALGPAGAGKLTSFGGVVLMACLFGRNLTHLHRPDIDDRDHDLNGAFWKRHRSMDNILLNTSLCLPGSLKLPTCLGDANAVFTNMCIHTSTICLHQAAIFKADKNKLPSSVSSESKVRCITAANEIASIMRMVSHLDLAAMNPFICFCLYVAARVFVQYLKSRPEDSQTADSLRFLLSAMNALKRRNPLTESFLVQLDIDLQALVSRIPHLQSTFPNSMDSPRNCVPDPFTGGTPQDGVKGVLDYRNQCNFMKVVGDDGNPVSEPDIVDPDPMTTTVPRANGPSGLGTDNWTVTEPSVSLPRRERASVGYLNSINAFNSYSTELDNGSPNDVSGTSSDRPSNRPTPNSSITASSEHRPGGGSGGLMPGSTMANHGSSGRSSFEASPVSSHQNLSNAGSVGAGTATGLTPPDPRFAMGEDVSFQSWANMSGQAAMTPVAEGVFRSMMSMGNIETMDIAWDANP